MENFKNSQVSKDISPVFSKDRSGQMNSCFNLNVSTEHLYINVYLESDRLAISGESLDVPNQQTHLIIAIGYYTYGTTD